MANCFKAKALANIDDFTILVRCGAVQSAIETAPCRSPPLLTAVFRIKQELGVGDPLATSHSPHDTAFERRVSPGMTRLSERIQGNRSRRSAGRSLCAAPAAHCNLSRCRPRRLTISTPVVLAGFQIPNQARKNRDPSPVPDTKSVLTPQLQGRHAGGPLLDGSLKLQQWLRLTPSSQGFVRGASHLAALAGSRETT